MPWRFHTQMPGHLDSVVALHHALVELDQAQQRLHGIPDWMQELHDEHSSKKAEIEQSEQALTDVGKERRSAEGHVEEAREKLKRYQKQINEVSTQREYGALLQEIDTVKQQINEGEELALAAMERSDQLKGEIETLRKDFVDLDERYAEEYKKWEAEKPGVAQQVEELEARVEALRERLPRNVKRQFDRIAERLEGAPLAPIRQVDSSTGRGPREWHCGACNYRVRPQVVVDIRNNGSLVQCDSCKRILFLEDD